MAASAFKKKLRKNFVSRLWGHEGFQFLAKVLGSWWWTVKNPGLPSWMLELGSSSSNEPTSRTKHVEASSISEENWQNPLVLLQGNIPSLGNSNYLKATIIRRTIQKTPSSSTKVVSSNLDPTKVCSGESLHQVSGKQQAIRYGQLEAMGDFNASS